MKIKDLKNICASTRGHIQGTILYDKDTLSDIVHGGSIEYVIENYGDNDIVSLFAMNDYIVIGI